MLKGTSAVLWVFRLLSCYQHTFYLWSITGAWTKMPLLFSLVLYIRAYICPVCIFNLCEHLGILKIHWRKSAQWKTTNCTIPFLSCLWCSFFQTWKIRIVLFALLRLAVFMTHACYCHCPLLLTLMDPWSSCIVLLGPTIVIFGNWKCSRNFKI